jgi:hypothetical protein
MRNPLEITRGQRLARIRVQRGIELLDRKAAANFGPENWRAKVNLATLEMADWYDCMLGQVFGDYSAGVDHFLSRDKNCGPWAERHGFDHSRRVSFADLNWAWKEALR